MAGLAQPPGTPQPYCGQGPGCLSPCVPSEGSSDRDVRALYPTQSWHVLVACPQGAEAEAAKTGDAFLDHQGWGSLPLEAAGLFHPGVCLRAFLPSSGSKTHLGLLPVHPGLGVCGWRPGMRRFQRRVGYGGHSLAPAHQLLPPPQAPRPCRSPSRTCRPRAAVQHSSRLSSRATHSPQ